MIKWPDMLVSDIARRRSVLFLGAGISKNSKNDKGERPMDWDQFLQHLAKKMRRDKKRRAVEQCIREGDLLTACDIARAVLKPDVFKNELLKEFSDKRFQPSSVHDDLIALDSRIVLTTNFDKLYETQANSLRYSTVLVKNYYDPDTADLLRRPQRCILKVHGSIDTPEKTIFTRSDYARARTAYGYFYRLVEALFLTHTFIFLGASMRDPDIRLLLEDYAYRYSGARCHYMVMPRQNIDPSVLEIMEGSMNLETVTYDPADGHKELAESLTELKDLVSNEREELTETLEW